MALTVTKFELTSRTMGGSSDRSQLTFMLRGYSSGSAGGSFKYKPAETTPVPIDPVYQEVQNYCELRLPLSYDGLDRESIQVDHLRDDTGNISASKGQLQGELFKITGNYTRPSGSRREQNPDTRPTLAQAFQKTRSFNGVVVPKREYYSKGPVGIALGRRPGTGPQGNQAELEQSTIFDNQQALILDSETKNPEGTDVLRPETTFTIEYSGNTFIPAEYTRKLERLVGRVNSTTFENRDRGEVLFSRYQVTESIEVASWDVGATYAVGDKVLWNGTTWIAIEATLAGEEPGVSPKWQTAVPTVATINFEFRISPNLLTTTEDWSAGASYSQGDLVNYNFNVYESQTSSNTGNNPETHASWEFQNEQVAIGRDSKGDTIIYDWKENDAGIFSLTDLTTVEGWDIQHAFYDTKYNFVGAPAAIADVDKKGTVPSVGFIDRLYGRVDLNAIFTIP